MFYFLYLILLLTLNLTPLGGLMPEIPLWEQQSYDSEKSYHCFSSFFLALEPEDRNLHRAYKKYLKEEKHRTKEQLKTAQVSPTWKRWANGQLNSGEPILNAKTWQERAAAYDESGLNIHEEIYRKAREAVVDKEIKDVNKQLHLWDDLHEELIKFYNASKKIAKEDEKLFNPSRFISKMAEVVKVRESLAVFARRSVKLPATIKPTEDDKAKKPIKIIWEDPKNFEDDVGIGEEELLSVKDETQHNITENTA
jgi:hypothetical protein